MTTNYKLEGSPNSPVLIFSNSLGSNLQMWDEVVPFLLPYFRVLRYDTRGHGGTPSDAPSEGLMIRDLGLDVIDLLDALNIQEAHFCGLSMGGLIGQWLGIHFPQRLKKLILSNTAAKIGEAATWNDRIKLVNQQGFGVLVDGMMERWFSDDFRLNNAARVDQIKLMFLQNQLPGYSACCGAIRDADFRPSIDQISVPTLVVTGDHDPVTNVEQAEFLAHHIPGAEIKVLSARHLSATEIPQAYAETLINFLVGAETAARGTHVRRTVLGDAHVDRAQQKTNAFNRDFQGFITHFAWGEIWTRPGLSKHNRSLITLAMLVALNRKAELELHLKAAIYNGVSVAEIKEVLLQAAVYCGVPAANDAIHTAEAIFQTLGIDTTRE
jgi:3-oxoadipate enol-lactonase/4-carboxymuconolactone decarboxylase